MKILLLAVAVLVVFAALGRQRVYVRDPLASVCRNDVKQTGVEVYINESNDVLLWQDIGDRASDRILVQGWNKVPGTPVILRCIRWIACLTDADHAQIYPISPAAAARSGKVKSDPHASMTSREVSFVDANGSTLRIELR
jgi:hypothetical protein